MKPVDQVHILYIQAQIQPPSMKWGILMLSKAFKIKWLSINQELGSFYLHCTDAKGFLIDIFSKGKYSPVQIRRSRPGPPHSGIRYGNGSRSSLCLCYLIPLHIKNFHMNGAFSLCLSLILKNPIGVVYVRYQGQTADAGNRCCIQPYRTVDSCIVKKVKIGKIALFSPYLGCFNRRHTWIIGAKKSGSAFISHWKRAVADPVVRRNGKQQRFSRNHKLRKLQLKRKKSSLMFHYKGSVYIDPCPVCHGIKTQKQPLPLKKGRNRDLSFIPGPSIVILISRIVLLIIIGCRDSNPFPSCKTLTVIPRRLIISKLKFPQAGKIHHGPCSVHLRI